MTSVSASKEIDAALPQTDAADDPKVHPRYFKLRTSGIGYIQRIEDRHGAGLVCELVALRGSTQKIEYTYMQLVAWTAFEKNLLKNAGTLRNDGRTVMIQFLAESCYPFDTKDHGLVDRGRLKQIRWIRVDGHQVYTLKQEHDFINPDSHSYRGLTELSFVEAALCAAVDEGQLTIEDIKTAYERSQHRVLVRTPGLAGVIRVPEPARSLRKAVT